MSPFVLPFYISFDGLYLSLYPFHCICLSPSLTASLSLSVSLSLFPSYCIFLSLFPSYCVSLYPFPSFYVTLPVHIISFLCLYISFPLSFPLSFSIPLSLFLSLSLFLYFPPLTAYLWKFSSLFCIKFKKCNIDYTYIILLKYHCICSIKHTKM